MDSFKLTWKRSARKELEKLPRPVIKRIVESINQLAINPYPAGTQKISGSEQTYRIRVGDYRILYTIEGDMCIIEIIRVGHRSIVYKR